MGMAYVEPDPRYAPDREKKLRSGVWRSQMDFDAGGEKWICDLFKLEDLIRHHLTRDRHFAECFGRNPERTLDMMFGEGTGRAYFTKRRTQEDVYMMRENPYYGERIDRCPTPPSPKKPSEKPYRSLVRTMPLQVSWINGQCSLTSQLDKEFKAWAGKQLSEVQRWKSPLDSKQLTINSTP